MRIQHNIAAMSSYRNYTNNVSAVNKNLEKLSSGYKINRAGDDAAGLAISEKMRAQISGLEAAQKNAKDGISLVKTAEGALQEVHDMLNRMVTLATQSANGTYDNEVDRLQLQKEVDQLKTEINRIADSANFNGIQLLNGDMDADGLRETTETIFSEVKAGTNVFGVAPDNATGFGGANKKGGLVLSGGNWTGTAPNPADGAVNLSDSGVRYHQEAKGEGKTTFTVDLDGINYSADPGDVLSGLTFCLQANNSSKNGNPNSGVNNLFLGETGTTRLTYNVTAGKDGITSEDIAKAIEKAIQDNDGKVYIDTKIDGTDGTTTAGKRVEYTVTRDGDKLTFTMTDKGYTTAAANQTDGDAQNYFTGNFNFNVAHQATGANAAFANAIDSKYLGNTSTCNINEGSKSSGTIYAQAYIRFDTTNGTPPDGYNKIEDVIADGAGLQIGNDYYIFAHSDQVYNTKYADNVHVVDIRDLNNLKAADIASNDAATKQAAYDDLRKALDRLSVAANDNEMFDVQVDERGTMIAINERTTYSGDANLTEKDWGLEKMIQKFGSATSTTTVDKEAGKSLTLQIGDTAEDFNQLKVNIKDCHTDSLGIKGVDISTQEGAQAAIDAIKSAINYVSDVRGTLGATQNRLEHTINNLSVMRENIQDAESTIRDTDIAEEMMAYTKNNILVQSAQAMLAQANQIPQGVLQLLG